MSGDDRTIVLDGEDVKQMARAGIVELWNEDGVLKARDERGGTWEFGDW